MIVRLVGWLVVGGCWLVVLDRMHRFDVADMMQDFLVIVGMMHCFVNANMNGYGKMYTRLF